MQHKLNWKKLNKILNQRIIKKTITIVFIIMGFNQNLFGQNYLFVEIKDNGDRVAIPRAFYIKVEPTIDIFELFQNDTLFNSILNNEEERLYVHVDRHFLLDSIQDSILNTFDEKFRLLKINYYCVSFGAETSHSIRLAIVKDRPKYKNVKYNSKMKIPYFILKEGVLEYIEKNTNQMTVVYDFW